MDVTKTRVVTSDVHQKKSEIDRHMGHVMFTLYTAHPISLPVFTMSTFISFAQQLEYPEVLTGVTCALLQVDTVVTHFALPYFAEDVLTSQKCSKWGPTLKVC